MTRACAAVVLFAAGIASTPLTRAANLQYFFQSGNSLYSTCSGGSVGDRMYCLAFVTAIADAMRTETVREYAACVPGGTSVAQEQLADVVLQSLRTRPQERHHDAVFIVARALSEAFPCTRSP